MRQWFVAESVRNREIAASLSVVALGLEAYVPIMQRMRRIGRQVSEVSTPRFGTYLFVKFDRQIDDWPALMHDGYRYFKRVLCNTDGVPVPVPDQAMDAIRAYRPIPMEAPVDIRYQPGQRVTCIIAGMRREAVFVEYCGGNRPMIRTWIFGADRIAEVSACELEPLELA